MRALNPGAFALDFERRNQRGGVAARQGAAEAARTRRERQMSVSLPAVGGRSYAHAAGALVVADEAEGKPNG